MGHGGDTPPFLKSVPRIFLHDSNENLKVDRAKKMFTQTRSLCRFKSTSDIREWPGRQNAQTRLECWEMRGDEYGDNVYTGAPYLTHAVILPGETIAKSLHRAPRHLYNLICVKTGLCSNNLKTIHRLYLSWSAELVNLSVLYRGDKLGC